MKCSMRNPAAPTPVSLWEGLGSRGGTAVRVKRVCGFLFVSPSFLKPPKRLLRKGRAFQIGKCSWEWQTPARQAGWPVPRRV